MSSVPPIRTVGNDDLIRLTVDIGMVDRFLRQVPKIAYFWLRNYFGKVLGQHRKHWLDIKGTKFGRGNGIRVGGVNDHKVAGGPLSVMYRVHPEEFKATSGPDATAKLNRLTAEVFTGNTVLPVHQFGQDIRSSRFMAIAVKTRPKTPARWMEKYPTKKLILRPSKKDPAMLVLYELLRVRGRGRPRKDGKGNTVSTRLRLRFLLTKFVDMKPTLKMYESWEQLQGARDTQWGETATRIQQDLDRGDPRDL
jgi:hypothetical protein